MGSAAERPEPSTRPPLDNARGLSYYPRMATKTTSITLRLGPKLREEAEAMAYHLEMNLGEYVRYAISEHLRTQEATDDRDS